jgi:Tfp pilus assembly protein PilO
MDKTKPKQEMKTSNYIALLIVISILVILVGGLAAKSLGEDLLHNQRVITKQGAAQKILAADVLSAQSITNQYQTLGAQQQLINDALPNESDLPGLANAVAAMAASSGSQLVDVSADTSGTTTSTPAAGTGATGVSSSSAAATPVPITLSATTSYTSLPAFLSAIEGSLRPIQVSDIQLGGSNNSLNVTIDATTYYQTPVSFTIGKETVK